MKTITTNPELLDFIAEDLPLVKYGVNQYQPAAPMSLEQLCSAMSLLLDNHFKRESILTSADMTRDYLVAKIAQ